MAAAYLRAADLPLTTPVFPLDGALLLPGANLPLNVFEPRYLNMVDDAMSGERIIGMVQTRVGGDPTRPKLAEVGCAGRITSYAETRDGRYLITLTGICRFRLGDELPVQTPYRRVRALFEPFEGDLAGTEDSDESTREPLLDALRAFLNAKGLGIDWDQASQAPLGALVNSLAMALPFEPPEKQALLEAPTPADRRAVLIALMRIDAEAGDEPDDSSETRMH